MASFVLGSFGKSPWNVNVQELFPIHISPTVTRARWILVTRCPHHTEARIEIGSLSLYYTIYTVLKSRAVKLMAQFSWMKITEPKC